MLPSKKLCQTKIYRKDGGFPLTKEQGFYAAEYDQNRNPYRRPEKSLYFDVLIDRSKLKAIYAKTDN